MRALINKAASGTKPEYEEVKGLTVDEARRMLYVYQRMHGGYRPEEHTVLEYYVFGEILMQFKRYLPSMLRNAFGSRQKLEPFGYYKPVLGKDGKPLIEDGKPVVEWQSRIIEGRFRVLLGLLLNALTVRATIGENLTIAQKVATAFGLANLESYN